MLENNLTLCIILKTDLTTYYILDEMHLHIHFELDFNAYGLEIGHLYHAVGGLLNNSFLGFKILGCSVNLVFQFVFRA